MITIDGKSSRGAHGPDRRAVHLLAAVDQANGIILGQTVVEQDHEINAFPLAVSKRAHVVTAARRHGLT